MLTSGSTKRRPHVSYGSFASVELSWHVGFTPDFGRMVATRRTDASGHFRNSPNDRQAYAGRSFSNTSASFKFDAFVNAASIRC